MEIKSVPFTRLGNKQIDIKHFYKYLPFDVKTVVEPFAGTFAVSRICYHPDKYKICLSDLDAKLSHIIANIREFDKVRKDVNAKAVSDKMTSFKQVREYFTALDISDEFKAELTACINIRGIVKTRKTESDYTDLFYFLDNVEYLAADCRLLMERYKDDPAAFVFIDPPYFSSFNATYYKKERKASTVRKVEDNTGIFIYILEYLKTAKCRVLVIINNNELLNYLFRDYIKDSYKKIYQLTKTEEELLICANY